MKNKINSLVTFLLFAIVMLQTSIAGDAKKAENFKLKDYNGKEYQLNDYKDKGVTFLGINSNKQESVDEIKEHAKSNKLDFIILKDLNNVVANKFDASFTPEIYVLNGNSEILYHGRIDDNRRESDVKTKDLRAALDEILAGKKVSVSETKAFGCTIKRVD